MTKSKNKPKPAGKKSKKNDLPAQIKAASEGLFYISETDAEIRSFVGTKAQDVSKEEILNQTGRKFDTPVEERNFDEIFARLAAVQDWHGDEEKAAAARFAELGGLLKRNLRDLKVFKVGAIELDVYFVGLDKDGVLTGIQTKALET